MGVGLQYTKGQSAVTRPVASQPVQLLNANLEVIDLPPLWKKQYTVIGDGRKFKASGSCLPVITV